MSTIQKQETFDLWKLGINERINDWKSTILKDNQHLNVDYSQKSLIGLEEYLIMNYNLSSLKDKKHNRALDACISYIGETILRLIPDSKWHIYIDDVSNIYYGLPCIVTLYSGSISVHYLLREILKQNDGQVLVNKIEKLINQDNRFRKLLKK